jgi:hypothetical protein
MDAHTSRDTERVECDREHLHESMSEKTGRVEEGEDTSSRGDVQYLTGLQFYLVLAA